MTKSIANLHQYTLDQLADRVAFKVDFFNRLFRSDNIWEAITEQCEKIEKEPRNVSSVILEAKKSKGIAIGGSSVTWYHTKLTRIYILLYYLHRDDKIYKALVFPELLRNMGIYCGEQILNTKINQEIDKIIDLDKMVEDVRAEKKKEVKPVFAYVSNSRNEQDHLYIEYNEEKLFRHMAGIISELSDKYDTNLDEANVWYNAKIVVHTLRDVNRPELLIRRAATALVAGQIYCPFYGSQIILICAYAMICASKDNGHFINFIKEMERLSIDADTDLDVIRDSIIDVKHWITENLPFDDNDYIGEQSSQNDTFTSADIERIRKQIIDQEKEESKKLQKKIEELETQLQEKDLTIKDLSYENSQWRKKKNSDTGEPLEEIKQLGIDERIIFYSSALRIDITDSEVNQTQLANFIATQTGCKQESVRPRIGKIATMQKSNRFTPEIRQAAKNVIDSLNKCFQRNSNIEEVHLTDTTSDIIDDIEKVYQLSYC